MMDKILPYGEGTVFAVPLRDGGYARGIVARASPKGGVAFGYFFGPRISSLEEVSIVDINPDSAVERMLFGDLGLINGDWPIIGSLPDWKRENWGMSDFLRRDPIMGRAWRVHRSDSNPSEVQFEEPVDADTKLPPDRLSGFGSVEIKLTKLLA